MPRPQGLPLNQVKTKTMLFHMLGANRTPYVEHEGKVYILNSVAREDGSGKKFNVTLNEYGNVENKKTVFVSVKNE